MHVYGTTTEASTQQYRSDFHLFFKMMIMMYMKMKRPPYIS